MNKEEERQFLLRCIELYQSLPCLWNSKSPEYMDREKKKIAYEIMLALYKEKFPAATTEDVKKKINSLRTNFRKEWRKINISKASGIAYEPTSWYFDSMRFLVDQESSTETLYFVDENEEFEQEEESCPIIPEVVLNTSSTKPIKRKFQKDTMTDKFLKMACIRLKEPLCEDTELANSWARELKNMAPEQKIFVKKFVNDIIFEGQMGTLHRNSLKINESEEGKS